MQHTSRFLKVAASMLCLALVSFQASAQSEEVHTDNAADQYWLNWKENEVTEIPSFNLKKSVHLENLDTRGQLDWYIDPATITIGDDSVVRYVVIAQSGSGVVNAMYEGIICKKDQYKTYARYIGKATKAPIEWRILEDAEWNDLTPYQRGYQYALATLYICQANATPADVRGILQRMKNPYDAKLIGPGAEIYNTH